MHRVTIRLTLAAPLPRSNEIAALKVEESVARPLAIGEGVGDQFRVLGHRGLLAGWR